MTIALDHPYTLHLLGLLAGGRGADLDAVLKDNGLPAPIQSRDEHLDDEGLKAVARIIDGLEEQRLFSAIIHPYLRIRLGIEVREVDQDGPTLVVVDDRTEEVHQLHPGDTEGKYPLNREHYHAVPSFGTLDQITPTGVLLSSFEQATPYEVLTCTPPDAYAKDAPSRHKLLLALWQGEIAWPEEELKVLAFALVTGVCLLSDETIRFGKESTRYAIYTHEAHRYIEEHTNDSSVRDAWVALLR